MATLAFTLGGLLALLIALLAVPLTIVFSIHRLRQSEGYVRFRWLFGLVRFQVRLPRPSRAEPEAEPRPAPAAKQKTTSPKRPRNKPHPAGMLGLLKQPAIRQRIYKFMRDMLAACHARNLFVRLRIGLGDPAETGRLWALVGPLAGLAQNLQSAEVRIEPEFMEPLFEVESHGRFRLMPIQFIALTMAFLLSPTMLRAWRDLRKGST